MATYEIELRDGHGRPLRARFCVAALSAERAVLEARLLMPAPEDGCLYAAFRRRRGRRSRLELIVGAGPGQRDGLAGVREPRRPLPDPGHLSVALDEPA